MVIPDAINRCPLWGRLWGSGMARGNNRLSARRVQTESRPGRHADGQGLYLMVSETGAKRWALIYSRGGRGAAKRSELGLGSAVDVTLAEAREKAAVMRAAIRRGDDPRSARELRAVLTFGLAADAYIDAMSPAWRNPKHIAQWRQTLSDAYCRSLRSRPVSEVGVADVLAVLTPIWGTVPETASRLRGRIEAVLDAAAARGERVGDNPARWRGHLAKLLPARQKLSRGHHAAMPWQDVPAFVTELHAREAMSAVCLEWTILTAARTGEAIAAEWSEIDGAVWTVPASRMKAKRPHRVPLCRRCLAILDHVRPLGSRWLFPGAVAGNHLSNMAMLEMVKPVGVTVHGFRSCFRDWVGEATSFPPELAELALAHHVGSAVERAYRRGDALDRRRELMDAWERFCLSRSDAVSIKRM